MSERVCSASEHACGSGQAFGPTPFEGGWIEPDEKAEPHSPWLAMLTELPMSAAAWQVQLGIWEYAYSKQQSEQTRVC